MPSTSQAQQKFFGIIEDYKKGKFKGMVSPKVKETANSMTKKQVNEFASTPRKGLPLKKGK